jgi:ubiquinol-cytochrome c reductase cytochrome c subunit
MRVAAVVLAALLLAGTAAADPPPQGVVHVRIPPGAPLKPYGAQLYAANCASCHGLQGEGHYKPHPGAGGILGQGPSLHGVGALAPDFYLRLGEMPLANPSDQPLPSKVLFGDREIRAIVAYVASFGRGPPIPKPHAERGSLAEGMRLFTDSCAGCHGIAAQGGIVTGAAAPPLLGLTAVQIAEAVRIGPYLMPSFSPAHISDRQLDSIIHYIERTKHPVDKGGWGLGHVGPVPEGLIAWLLAGTALLIVARVIGKALRR